MPVPTHSFNCTTRAFLTSCPSCKEDVYFFSCNCGSKVYFDNLGYPWTEHLCYEYKLALEIELIQNVDHLSSDEIYRLIIKLEKKFGEISDQKIWDIIESVIGKRKLPLTVSEEKPGTMPTEIAGRVMELNNTINIFKKLGYDESNAISKKLLGKIGAKNWAMARIRTKVDKKNRCIEYWVLIELGYLKSNKLKKGDFILAIAEPLAHLKGIEWKLVKHEVY